MTNAKILQSIDGPFTPPSDFQSLIEQDKYHSRKVKFFFRIIENLERWILKSDLTRPFFEQIL